MANIVTIDKLRFFLRKKKNVIIRGKHGCGKTSCVIKAFEEEGIRYRAYSAATMDPWVDFIGVPRAVPNGDGAMQRGCQHPIDPKQSLPFCIQCGAALFVPVSNELVLELARPAEWAHNEVQAIFFDEYNRSAKKIRNAVMELIQFKSINGRKFPNLQVVWAAVNPDDDETLEYDVETIDPAQLDRFHVQLDMPYKPDRKYFRDKFGNEVADASVAWWGGIPVEIQNKVSPRRLDYALEIWKDGGHLEDALPMQANVSALRDALKTTPVMETLRKLFSDIKEAKEAIAAGNTPKVLLETSEEQAKIFLADENNYSLVSNDICKKPVMISMFVPLMPEEKIASLIHNDTMVRNYFMRNLDASTVVREVMESIVASDVNSSVSRELSRAINRAKLDKIKNVGSSSTPNPNRLPGFSACPTNTDFANILAALKSQEANLDGTIARNCAYSRIENSLPVDMSHAEAVACLKMLDFLISRSHRKTIVGWVHLVGIVNTCIENLIKHSYDFKQFVQDFPKLLPYIVHEPGFYFSVI